MALRTEIISFTSVVVLLFMLPSISSASQVSNQTLLNYSYQNLLCKTDFTFGYATNVIAVTENGTINSQVTALETDTATAKADLYLGNASVYTNYVQNTYDPQLKLVGSDIHATISARGLSLSQSNLTQLFSDYNKSKAAYLNCSSNTLKAFAQARINQYKWDISSAENKTAKLQAKGLNVSNLESLALSANTTIVVPLQNAVSASTNSSQIQAALQRYCLYDGCKNGTNFHFAAHYALDTLVDTATEISAKINASLAKINFTFTSNALVQPQNIPRIVANLNSSNATANKTGFNASGISSHRPRFNGNYLNYTNRTGRRLNGTYNGIPYNGIGGRLRPRLNTTTLRLIFNFTGQLKQAWTYIDNATAQLNVVGTSAYKGNQSSVVWSDIRTAASLLAHLKLKAK
jgi:hypothetical protein